jgi:hypothetical protein
MKKILAFAAAALFASAAGATHFNGNPFLERSALNDHRPGAHSSAGVILADRWGSENSQNAVLVEADKPVEKHCYQVRDDGNSEMRGSILLDIPQSANAFGAMTVVASC